MLLLAALYLFPSFLCFEADFVILPRIYGRIGAWCPPHFFSSDFCPMPFISCYFSTVAAPDHMCSLLLGLLVSVGPGRADTVCGMKGRTGLL